MKTRKNHLREKLLKGQSAYGLMAFEFFTPGLLPILSEASADFVILDMEHSGLGMDVLKAQLGAARGTSTVPIVRVPGTARHLISPVLDAGAMGIMVPLVETRAQAIDIVTWCKYRPQGTRGLGFSVAHDDYSGGSVVEKINALNERTLVIALIESETGIENAEEILSVPGIDVGWLGHYDLTDSMGIPGQFEHPRFKAAVKSLLSACKKYGKSAGFLASDMKQAIAWKKKGFRCLGYGTDIGLLRDSLSAGLAHLRTLD